LTTQLGLADSIGQVYGESIPSVSGVEVIGEVAKDRAINVFFEDRNKAYWFSPQLLDFIDHGAGTEITLDGVPKKWTRTITGEWDETDTQKSAKKKPWWKLWTGLKKGR